MGALHAAFLKYITPPRSCHPRTVFIAAAISHYRAAAGASVNGICVIARDDCDEFGVVAQLHTEVCSWGRKIDEAT